MLLWIDYVDKTSKNPNQDIYKCYVNAQLIIQDEALQEVTVSWHVLISSYQSAFQSYFRLLCHLQQTLN